MTLEPALILFTIGLVVVGAVVLAGGLYFAFACVWFWGCIALGYIQTFHFWVPLLGALAPALSALVVTSMAEGEPAVRELGRSLRKWRVGWQWYLVAFGLPIAEGLMAVGAASAFGVFKLTRIKAPWFKNGFIRIFMRWFNISLAEAELPE